MTFSGEGSCRATIFQCSASAGQVSQRTFQLLRAKWEIANSIAQEGALIFYFSRLHINLLGPLHIATWRLKLDLQGSESSQSLIQQSSHGSMMRFDPDCKAVGPVMLHIYHTTNTMVLLP
jgi:hypothetical protein